MITKITITQSRKINNLIRKTCCNCVNDNCLLLDDGEECKCVQLISYSGIFCNYFKRAVLPSDKELELEIYDNDKKQCKICGNVYTSISKNQQYCKSCAEKRKRQKATERQRKKRAKKSRF